jgi:transposase
MARTSRYSQEVRERAVRMVFEHRGEYASEWEAICSIAEKIGCSSETLRKWVRRMEIDMGRCANPCPRGGSRWPPETRRRWRFADPRHFA